MISSSNAFCHFYFWIHLPWFSVSLSDWLNVQLFQFSYSIEPKIMETNEMKRSKPTVALIWYPVSGSVKLTADHADDYESFNSLFVIHDPFINVPGAVSRSYYWSPFIVVGGLPDTAFTPAEDLFRNADIYFCILKKVNSQYRVEVLSELWFDYFYSFASSTQHRLRCR